MIEMGRTEGGPGEGSDGRGGGQGEGDATERPRRGKPFCAGVSAEKGTSCTGASAAEIGDSYDALPTDLFDMALTLTLTLRRPAADAAAAAAAPAPLARPPTLAHAITHAAISFSLPRLSSSRWNPKLTVLIYRI